VTPLLCLWLAAAPKAGATDGGVRNYEAARSALEQQAIDESFAKMMAMLGPDGGLGYVRPMFQWHLSNIISSIDIPGIVMADGFPVKLHAFRVKADQGDIFQELTDQFKAQGLYMKPMGNQPQPTQQLQLTALDYQRFISYTAFVEPHADGTCTVMLGEANIAEGLEIRKRNEGAADFAPLYPSASAVMRSMAEGLDTLAYRTAASELEVLAFYQKEMKARGYTEQPGNAFRKQGEEIRVVARRIDGLLSVVVTRSSGPLAP